MVRFTFPGGKFNATAATLRILFEWAYGIQSFQHSTGPSWMDNDRYDVIAKAEGNATDAQIRLMLQTLLADRFKLKLHHESKSLPVYVLTLGKSAPKLVPSKGDEPHSLQITPTELDSKLTAYHVVAKRFELAQLTDIFARQLGRVLVNKTGLDGDFDFTLDFTPDENRPNPMDPSIIITALRNQLGLTVKTENEPVDFLVIDSAVKVSAEI